MEEWPKKRGTYKEEAGIEDSGWLPFDVDEYLRGGLGKVGKLKKILTKMRDPKGAIEAARKAKAARDEALKAKRLKAEANKMKDANEYLGTMQRNTRVNEPSFEGGLHELSKRKTTGDK